MEEPLIEPETLVEGIVPELFSHNPPSGRTTIFVVNVSPLAVLVPSPIAVLPVSG